MSISEQTLERIKAQLRQGKEIGGNVPQDLYSHLTEVFNRILLHHPQDAYEKFEEISALVKQTDLKFKDPKYDFEVNESEPAREQTDADRWVLKCKNLINEINDLVPAKDKKFLTKDRLFAMPNIIEQAEMLDWAGINFGEETTYLLQKSIKRLAVMSGADSVQLCGKIFGQKCDYWIACGELAKEEDQNDAQCEPRGTGVNKVVFWVTTNLLNDWVQLPDARPEHIVAARRIKHVFTGDLNASFDSNPAFPGKERHFLRATLARIFSATAIVPQGLMQFDDETKQITYAEDYEQKSTDALNELGSWTNLHQQILTIGRATYKDLPEDMDEETRGAEEAKREAEPQSVLFEKAIGGGEGEGHVPVKGHDSAWTSKIVGDTQKYNSAKEGGAELCYAVNVIRSLRWPGALTVAKGGKFLNFYLGYGMKKGDSSYQPTEPPEVCRDPDEVEMQDEPNPKHPPEEPPEDDTDKEEEKEDDDDN